MNRFLKNAFASALLMAAGHSFAQQPTEIVVDYVYPDLFKEVNETIARDFMDKFPQYKVTFRAPAADYEVAAQQALRQSVTGQLADVSFQGLNRQRVFADRGLAVDLTPFIKAEKEWAKMGYDAALLSLGQVNGQQVGIGFALSTPVVYYNADLMRKAGVEAGNFPTTWDALIAAAKKSKQQTSGSQSLHVEWDITGNWLWQALVFGNGGTMLTPDEKKVAFDGPSGKAAIETLDRMVKEGEMRNISYSAAAQDFTSGKLAVLVTTTARLGALTNQVGNKFDIRTARLPVAHGGRLPAGGNVAMMFAKDPAKRAAAWEYIKFATGPQSVTKMVKKTGYFPGNTLAANDPSLLQPFYKQHPNHMTAIQQMPLLTGWYAFPGDNGLKITDVIKDYLQTVVSQETKPDVALAEMSRSVQALLPH